MCDEQTLTHADLLSIVAGDIDPEGHIIDGVTGEVLNPDDPGERFTIDSAEKAEWALELRSRIEADILALEARKVALLTQLKALEDQQRRRLNWWDWRFRGQLVAFARSLLAGGKSKTARFAWGSVAFRTTPGTHSIINMDEAVAWMKVFAPERVRRKVTESVTIRDVVEVRDRLMEETGDAEHLGWLKQSERAEKITIDTGIGTSKKEGRSDDVGDAGATQLGDGETAAGDPGLQPRRRLVDGKERA